MASLGTYRVRPSHARQAPEDAERADEIKRRAAALIDAIEAVADGADRAGATGEVRRLKALAMTAAEEAAMWGVKAATNPEPD
jgi:hypothetical protein